MSIERRHMLWGRGIGKVNLGTLADGDVLSYDAATGKWVNEPGGGGYFTLEATERVVGSDAGTSQTGDNVFLAMAGAGDNNTVDDVIAIGKNALGGNGAGLTDADAAGSIAIGNRAAEDFAAGEVVIAIGEDAIPNITQAFALKNTVIGHQTGANMAAGALQSATYLGFRAGWNTTDLFSTSVIIGANAAGNRATTLTSGATQNVIVGCRAYGQGAGGSSNVIVGYEAWQAGNLGANNVYIGNQVCLSVTAQGDQNVIIGGLTVAATTTLGDGNTLLGANMIANSLGNRNTFIGHGTIPDSVAVGDDNVIIGYDAGIHQGTSFTDIFIIENNAGTTGDLNPYLYGDLQNGNLALMPRIATSNGGPTGTRLFQKVSWGTGTGLFTLYGAGTVPGSIAVPTDFAHIYLDSDGSPDSAPSLKIMFDDDVIHDIRTSATVQTYTLNATAVLNRTLLASASATTLNNNNVLAALITDLIARGIIK